MGFNVRGMTKVTVVAFGLAANCLVAHAIRIGDSDGLNSTREVCPHKEKSVEECFVLHRLILEKGRDVDKQAVTLGLEATLMVGGAGLGDALGGLKNMGPGCRVDGELATKTGKVAISVLKKGAMKAHKANEPNEPIAEITVGDETWDVVLNAEGEPELAPVKTVANGVSTVSSVGSTASLVVGVAGIVAAPFTGGASLGVTAGAMKAGAVFGAAHLASGAVSYNIDEYSVQQMLACWKEKCVPTKDEKEANRVEFEGMKCALEDRDRHHIYEKQTCGTKSYADVERKTLEDCESTCDLDEKCVAFSYNKHHFSCALVDKVGSKRTKNEDSSCYVKK
eukprot:TRINITY_DN44408_c0_g1_i1.p1 TRINITY_DN44408_c0_g1~~TRINITY_DN44408_c0_g1_i1.p1  ORF type:complete len:361 (+),score=50.32 TRINITY_DN44408_c0_g1_i1:74-1084(+)